MTKACLCGDPCCRKAVVSQHPPVIIQKFQHCAQYLSNVSDTRLHLTRHIICINHTIHKVPATEPSRSAQRNYSLINHIMTPKKTRHHRSQNSQSHLSQAIQPSDYESEAPFNPPPVRTNTDLNLSVLRRYKPSVDQILSIAASAVIYNFVPPDANNTTPTWEKAELEGTLFVCETLPTSATGRVGCCLMVLNKKGLDNLIIDIEEVQDVEITTEFLILRVIDRSSAGEKVIGVYIHPDREDTRDVNSIMIKKRWEESRESFDNGNAGNNGREVYQEGPFTGRHLDVNQLFAQQAMR